MTLIDLHTHGIAGDDSRSTAPEAYIRMAQTYQTHGTGAFLVTLFPGPVDEMRAQMAAVKAAMESQEGDGARILGLHLEGPFVNPAKCGALDSSAFLAPSPDALSRLIDGFEAAVRIITVAPELPGALALIESAASLGIRVNMGHSAATIIDASEGARAGATGVTHLFNTMTGLHHREPGLAGYALANDDLYVELIADMVHVHPEMLRLVTRCKPTDRIILVSDSLAEARTTGHQSDAPIYLPDGITLAGSGITLAGAAENMASLGVPHDEARAMASDNPARYLGIC